MGLLNDKRVFFVCGTPKSGTTWLQRVLDTHPQVQCSGEGHFIERFTVPLAGVLRGYAARMAQTASRVYEGKPYYPPLTQGDLDRIARSFVLDRLMSRKPGPQVRWIGDKTPGYASTMPQLLRLFPQARFINIIRDPRDVAVARLHHSRRVRQAENLGASPLDLAAFVHEGALDWARCVEPIAAFMADNPGQLHNVRYEDMIADPAAEAAKVYRFLGIRHDAATIAGVIAATSFEALSGRKPGQESATSFLRKGVVGDWVGQLDEAALGELHAVCGDLMRRCGYV